MIVSASRRTDIPAFYSEWFLNRIKERFVLVRNPVRYRQVSRVSLDPAAVDAVVFWTKNPIPMLDRLDALNGYAYLFQFTITPYGEEIEPNLPPKRAALLPAFKRLSDRIGAERMVWRYDPIFINERYSPAFHLRAFEEMAKELRGCTHRVTISFIDERYRCVKRHRNELSLSPFPAAARIELAAALAQIARGYGLAIDACAEKLDLQPFGIGRAHCIDGALWETLLGCRLKAGKDRNQRPECGCTASVDIGAYNSCRCGCRYCYASYGSGGAKHDPQSPLLLGEISPDDQMTERRAVSCRDAQLRQGELSAGN